MNQAFSKLSRTNYSSLDSISFCTGPSALRGFFFFFCSQMSSLARSLRDAINCNKFLTVYIYIAHPFLPFLCTHSLPLFLNIRFLPNHHTLTSSLGFPDLRQNQYEALSLHSSCCHRHHRMHRPSRGPTDLNSSSSRSRSLASKAFSSWPHCGSKGPFTTATLSQVPFGRRKPPRTKGPIGTVTLPNGRRKCR